MSKKHQSDKRGFVYSTDPDFSFESEQPDEQDTLPPGSQQLRLLLDTKQRAGKAVTLVTGFIGKTNDLEELGKKLKNHCGSGGSVKNGEVLVQGNHRQKLAQFLSKLGYKVKFGA
ncbi:MAG: translation initiation factor [Bacteroidetes bacterium]|nr:translation initiation factor [Bacteroidota bacterium]